MMPFPKVENTKDDQFGVVMVRITQFFLDLLFDLPLNLKNGVDNEIVGKLNNLEQATQGKPALLAAGSKRKK